MKTVTLNGKELTEIKVNDELTVWVDKDAKIQIDNWYLAFGNYPDRTKVNRCSDKIFENPKVLDGENNFHNTGHWLIIATQGTQRIEGVPCLVEKDEIERLAEEAVPYNNGEPFAESRENWIAGYKAASKGYSESDIFNAFGLDMGHLKMTCTELLDKLHNQQSNTIEITPEQLKEDIIYI